MSRRPRTRPPRPGISTIARDLGVPKSTVHRVLAGTAGKRLDPSVAVRIHQAAKAAGVRVARTGRDETHREQHLIGLVSHVSQRWANTHYERIVPICAQRAADAGYGLLLVDTGEIDDPQALPSLRRVAGFVVHECATDSWDRFRQRIDRPMVLVNWGAGDAGSGAEMMDAVWPDDVGGMELLTNHLLELGHRQIAFLEPGTARHSWSMRQRRETMLAITAATGAQCREFATAQMAHLLTQVRDRAITAITCYGSGELAALLPALATAGLRVPDDVSIACGDDNRLCQWHRITALAVPFDDLAGEATELLVERLRGALPREPIHRLLPEPLMCRGSTATC